MSKQNDQELIEKLANMHELVTQITNEYNKIASSINLNSRLGIVNSIIYDYGKD